MISEGEKDRIKYQTQSNAREQLWEILEFMGGIIAKRVNWDIAETAAHDLWELAGPKKKPDPWSGNYIISVLKNQIDPSGLLIEAIDRLSKVLIKGAYRTTIVLSEVRVRAPEGTPPGAIITKKAKQCSRPGCNAWYFPNSWNHNYHTKECYQEHKEMKRSYNK